MSDDVERPLLGVRSGRRSVKNFTSVSEIVFFLSRDQYFKVCRESITLHVKPVLFRRLHHRSVNLGVTVDRLEVRRSINGGKKVRTHTSPTHTRVCTHTKHIFTTHCKLVWSLERGDGVHLT